MTDLMVTPSKPRRRLARLPVGLSIAERFERSHELSRDTGCWIWLKALDNHGYPRLMNAGRNLRIHRWSYEHFVGPILPGLQIDHICRTRACVNPGHLDAVTVAENRRRVHLLPSELAALMEVALARVASSAHSGGSSNPDAGFEINDRSEVAQ